MKGQLARLTLTAAIVSTLAASILTAQSWPQWRGPLRTGAATAFKAPAAWPDRPKQVWKVQVGTGHSSPLAVDGRAFAFGRIGEQEVLTAWDLTSGKQIWRGAYDAPYQMNSAATTHGKGPKSTPVYDSGRIFSFGIAGTLSAWQAADGRLLWRKDFKKEFPATSPDYGVAMSPIVSGSLVVLHAGGPGNGELIALDVATGAPKWAWKGDGPAYASPVIAEIGGTRQLITQSQRHVVAVSMADGRLLWEIPFTTEYDQSSITPVVVDDQVIYSGINKPATAVRVTQSGGKWRTEQVWQNPDVPMYMSTPVVSNGYLFGLTERNKGQFFCLDPRTGKTMWTTRGREGDNAALVTAAGLILAVTTEGELVVARDNPKQFEVVKRYTVAESPVWAHPAVVDMGLLIKDEASLTYWVF
jgi:outer membrane protein assembly factor BamB